MTSDPEMAPVAYPKTADTFDRSGLPGTVRSENSEDLAFVDGKRHVVDAPTSRIPFAQMSYLDNRHASTVAENAHRYINQMVTDESTDRLMPPWTRAGCSVLPASSGILARHTFRMEGEPNRWPDGPKCMLL